MPGDYRVTLVVDGKDIGTKTLRVSGDKDMPMTDAERKTWHDTALSLHEMQRAANAAAEAVTTLATQLTAAETLLKSAANPPASAKTQVADAGTKLADLRRRLGLNQQQGGGGGGGFGGQQGNVRGQLGQTKGQIMGSTSLPTAQQLRSERRAARGPDQGGRRHQRVDHRDPGDLRRAGRIGREANRAQTGGTSPAGTLVRGSAAKRGKQ